MAALLGLALTALAVPSGASPLPPVSAGTLAAFTLYGSAFSGWGFGANNTTKPGPTLYVNYGDTVELTLISIDGTSVTHDWFIDYTNSTTPRGDDPLSPHFSAGNSVVWNFTANRIGTYVYRCEFHPSSMLGLIVISAPTHYTLYGSVAGSTGTGWGFSPSNISAPGPTLIVAEGANVTLTLYSADGATHTWYIDYDNSSSVNGAEAQSPGFGGVGLQNPRNYSFTPTRGGTFVYRCGIHPQMWGMIIVVGAPGPAAQGLGIGLVPGIMVVVIVGVLLLAAVYQVRATRAARMRK